MSELEAASECSALSDRAAAAHPHPRVKAPPPAWEARQRDLEARLESADTQRAESEQRLRSALLDMEVKVDFLEDALQAAREDAAHAEEELQSALRRAATKRPETTTLADQELQNALRRADWLETRLNDLEDDAATAEKSRVLLPLCVALGSAFMGRMG